MDEIGNRLKEKAYGHPEIWKCTLYELIEKVIPEIQKQQIKNKVPKRIITTAIGFLRVGFDQQKLKGTIEYEVANAIQGALIYHVNILGEEV